MEELTSQDKCRRYYRSSTGSIIEQSLTREANVIRVGERDSFSSSQNSALGPLSIACKEIVLGGAIAQR